MGIYTQKEVISMMPFQASASTSTPSKLLEYQNSSYGVRFQFPADWKKIEILAGKIALVEFVLPPQNISSKIPESITVSIEKHLPNNLTTPAAYINASNRLLNSTFGVFNMTSLKSTTLSGLPAFERVINSTERAPGFDLRIGQVFTIKNDKAYIITYAASPSTYNKYIPVVDELVKTFQIISTANRTSSGGAS